MAELDVLPPSPIVNGDEERNALDGDLRYVNATNSHPDPTRVFDPNMIRNVLNPVTGSDHAEALSNRAFGDIDFLKQNLTTAASSLFLAAQANYDNKPKYSTRYVSSQVDVDELQRTFPQYVIITGTTVSSCQHPYARESRMLEHRYVFDILINARNSIKLAEGYDVLVKDVGGNPMLHDLNGRSCVHTCSPVLNTKDNTRHASWINYVQSYGKDARVCSTLRPVVSDYISDRKLVCHKKSQFCKVKAPIVTFIHSTYDISYDDIGDILDSSNANSSYIVFLFQAEMMFESSGRIPRFACSWNKFYLHGDLYITFCFDTDASVNYTHLFKNYVSLISKTIFTTPSGRNFSVEREFRNFTMYMKLDVYVGPVNSELVITRLPFLDDPDTRFVGTWMYDMNVRSAEHMKHHVVKTSKKFFDNICGYAMSLMETKFTVDTLKRYAMSINNTMVVGTVTQEGPKHDPEDITVVVYTAYDYIYKLNFNSSKAVQMMTNDTQYQRRLVEKTWAMRCLFRLWYSVTRRGRSHHPAISSSGLYADPSSDPVINQIFPEITDETSMQDLLDESWKDKIEKMFPDFKEKYPLAFCGPRVMTCAEFIESGIAKSEPPSYTHSGPLTAKGYLSSPHVSVHSDILSQLKSDPYTNQVLRVAKARSTGKDPMKSLPEYFKTAESCNCRLTPTTIPGDGNCFYHCLIKHLCLKVSPEQVRNRLVSSRFLSLLCSTIDSGSITIDMEKRKEILERVTPREVQSEPSGWANDDVIFLSCLEYSITVCVHTSTSRMCSVFNPINSDTNILSSGHVMHLHYSNNHFQLMTEDVSCIEKFDEYSIQSSVKEFTDYEVSDYTDDYENLLVTGTQKVIKRHRDYAKHGPFKSLNNFGYSSGYGPMLSCALDYLYKQPQPAVSVLDVDSRNGSSAQVLADYSFGGEKSIVSVGLSSKTCKANVAGVTRRMIWKLSDDMKRNTLEFAKAFRNQSFDLLCLNPAYYSDELSFVDGALHDGHIDRVLPALNYLKPGGSLVVALSMPLTKHSAILCDQLVDCFDECSLIVPKVCPSYVPWVFFACRSKILDISVDNLYLCTKSPEYKMGSEVYSHFPVINDEYRLCLADELSEIVDESYKIPSEQWINKLRSFFTTLGVRPESFEAGFLPIALPSTGASVPESEFLFDRSFVASRFGNLRLPFSKQNFPQVARKYYEEYRDLFLNNNNINFSEKALSGWLKKRADEDNIETFEYKYGLSLYLAMNSKKNFVDFGLSLRDLGKPITSTCFYSNKMVSALKLFFHDVKTTLFSRSEESDDEGPYIGGEHVLVPNNVELFDAPEAYPPTLTVAYKFGDDIDSDDEEYSSTVSTTNPSAGSSTPDVKDNWFADPTVRKEHWVPDCYGTSVKDKAGAYLTEYTQIISTHLDLLRADLGRTANNLLMLLSSPDYDHSATRTKRRQIMHRLSAPFLAEYPIEQVILMNSDECLIGKESSLTSRRYVFVFGNKNGKCFDAKFVSVNNYLTYKAKVQFALSVPALEVLMEQDIASIEFPDPDAPCPDISCIQAGPGCGKTHTVLEMLADHVESSESSPVAVMKNVENSRSAKARLQSMLSKKRRSLFGSNDRTYCELRITTIDTILSSAKMLKSLKELKPNRLLVDEAMTHHPGKIVLLAMLVGVPVTVFGDVAQIGYICRVNSINPQYSDTSKAFPIVGLLSASYRCPGDVCYELSPRYSAIAKSLGITVSDERGVLSTHGVRGANTISVVKIHSVDQIPVAKSMQLLPFLQQDKQTLISKFEQKTDHKILTVHEYQGNENTDVALVRLCLTKDVSISGEDGVFGSDQHIVSAISRHTKRCTYFTVDDNDKLSKIIRSINSGYRSWYVSKSANTNE